MLFDLLKSGATTATITEPLGLIKQIVSMDDDGNKVEKQMDKFEKQMDKLEKLVEEELSKND